MVAIATAGWSAGVSKEEVMAVHDESGSRCECPDCVDVAPAGKVKRARKSAGRRSKVEAEAPVVAADVVDEDAGLSADEVSELEAIEDRQRYEASERAEAEVIVAAVEPAVKEIAAKASRRAVRAAKAPREPKAPKAKKEPRARRAASQAAGGGAEKASSIVRRLYEQDRGAGFAEICAQAVALGVNPNTARGALVRLKKADAACEVPHA